MGVTEEILRPFLEGWTLDQVIEAKRLFIVDHEILTGITHREGFCVSIVCSCENKYSQICVKRPYKTRHIFGFLDRWLLIAA